jgi:hypothetical protein
LMKVTVEQKREREEKRKGTLSLSLSSWKNPIVHFVALHISIVSFHHKLSDFVMWSFVSFSLFFCFWTH